MNQKWPTILFMSIVLNLFAVLAHANTPDDQQPVHISADYLEIQDQKGISVYKGNVEVTQGSLTLNGDKITIQHPDRALLSIKVLGQQARFKRFDIEDDSWIKGQADTINYNAQQKTLLLIGNAKVEQPGKHVITGPKLFYDTTKKTLKAQSTPQEKKRISVTLMPESK